MAEEQKPAVAEVVKNCAGCKKPVKKARRYFRDGKYYCNYNCWRNSKAEKAAEAKEQEVKS